MKRLFTSETIAFRRGDNVSILFNVYNDGEEFNINSATKAVVYQKTTNGHTLSTECTFEMYKGKRVVRFDVEDIAMVELGYLSLILTIWENDSPVSIQPFNVLIYDDYIGGASSYLELIQELSKAIDNLSMDLNNTVKLSEKGQPNGIASLDENGKIYLDQMPIEFDGFLSHIDTTIFKDKVHGMQITEDGIMQYEHHNGWQNVGFAPNAVGGSGSANQILSATVSVFDGIATVTYTGVPTVVSQKWSTGDKNKAYFLLNGNTFTDDSFEIDTTGLYTLWYKDSNGNTYTVLFNVETSMLKQPNVEINVVDGNVTVDVDMNTSIKKWDKGEYDIPYFQYNGNIFTGNTFEVTDTGKYTVYIKLDNDVEYVYVFEVTLEMLPDTIPPSYITNFTGNATNGTTVILNWNNPPDEDFEKVVIRYSNNSYPSTIDDGELFYQGNLNTAELNNLTESTKYYFRAFTVDYSGNVNTNINQQIEVVTKSGDVTPPTLNIATTGKGLKLDSTGRIKVGAVKMSPSASDNGSGLDKILLPDGSYTTWSYGYEYYATSNGEHTFKAIDKSGNETVKTITVPNIGSPIKIHTLEVGTKFFFNGEEFVLIEKTTTHSLIAQVNINYNGNQRNYSVSQLISDLSLVNLGSYFVSDTAVNNNTYNNSYNWNVGKGIPTNINDLSKTININDNFETTRTGVLNINQLKTAYANNWLTTSLVSDFTTNKLGEWSCTPYSSNEMFIMNEQGQPAIASISKTYKVRPAYWLNTTAETYGLVLD